MTTQKKSLRLHMRELRKKLTAEEQLTASYSLLANLLTQPWFSKCRHIALYLSNDGEINLSAIYQEMWLRGKNCYLPALHPWQKRQLWFLPFEKSTHLAFNRFSILEPTKNKAVPFNLQQLDIVLVPLVAFDKTGGRLGMGGGFYDKTFAFKNRSKIWRRPRFIGVAHSFQEVEKLDIEPWDIPLDGIITDRGSY